MESCRGSVGRNGIIYRKRIGDNCWQRIGYEAKQVCRNQNIKPAKKLNYLSEEPTWGDMGKIIDIIKVLNPINKSVLLSGFGLPLSGPKHLQIVRNACHHKNWETMNYVKALVQFYNFSNLKTPSFLAWEVDINKNEFAYYAWIDDLKLIAENISL